MDRRLSVYHDLIEISSVQMQNQKYFEDRENQYIDMIQVPRRFYEQVTYSNQKSICICRKYGIVPIENNMHVIYHNPTKRSF